MSANERSSDVAVRGVAVGPQARCAHYHSARDIVAIKFPCCGAFYACFRCHRARAGHAATPWPVARFDEQAVRCGACASTFSIRTYLDAEPQCPRCGAAFNPGCAHHRDRYFGR
jgi:uncharacterized CHY-type Zn-finger protein